MRIVRLLVLPVLLFAMLGCGLASQVQQFQEAATQLPALLTAAPSALSPLETAAAKYTPSASGQPLSLSNIKLILEMTQQFEFTDESIDDQPASVARLTKAGKAAFPTQADGFSAAFMGSDPSNLSHIRVTAPRSDDEQSVQEGMGLTNIALSGALSPEIQADFISWLSKNYPGLEVLGMVETNLGDYQFALQRSNTNMMLDISPSKK
jgi:hypothetical protein